ncbi:MAG: hypothetical protein ABI639_14685, partial [Thermoanaerobaculia bacterium]
MERLRERLEELEGSLTQLENDRPAEKNGDSGAALRAAKSKEKSNSRSPKPGVVRPERRGKGEAK